MKRYHVNFGSTIFTALTWGGVVVLFAPIIWMILTSFKSEQDAVSYPPKLIFTPTLEHYARIFDNDFASFFLVSSSVTIVSTTLVMVLAIPAAYALSIRPILKWRDVLFFFISTKMMPIAAGIVPLYLVARSFGLLNTPLVLMIVYISMNLPLAIWMLSLSLELLIPVSRYLDVLH